MAKELTHRAGELKTLGWSQDDLTRYIELWEYRQRWGAINLEREDRQFLKKAESSLPELIKHKASIKKSINEKSYYRRLKFYLDAMNLYEEKHTIPEGARGLWPLVLEEELGILDHYQPVLGLPDTLKAKNLIPLREKLVFQCSESFQENIEFLDDFDFEGPLLSLKAKEKNNWRPLREGIENKPNNYPVLNKKNIQNFRSEVRNKLLTTILDEFPSLANIDKPAPAQK